MSAKDNDGFLLVIIGSDKFDFYKTNSYDKLSFKNSAIHFHNYMTEHPTGLKIEKENVLNLFGSNHKVEKQDEILTNFINRSPPSCVSLFIYYVGHGGFFSDRQYYLSLKKTNPKRLHFTALRIRDLAETLKTNALNKRIFLILDCCFAGAAVKEFMSQNLSLHIEKQTFTNLPELGTALLVAASKDEPAIAPDGNEFTMFSEILIQVLENGSKSKGEYLSIRDIGSLVKNRLIEKYGIDTTLPEIHAPKQINSDVSDRPIFINNSFVANPKKIKIDLFPIYNSDTEASSFSSWVLIKPNVPGMTDLVKTDKQDGVRILSLVSKSTGAIGANKYIICKKGKINFDFKVIDSSGANIVFFVLPLHVKTKEEIKTTWEGIRGYSMLYDDFQNTKK